MLLSHFYGVSAEVIRKTKAIRFAYNTGEDEDMSDNDLVGKHTSDAYEWRRFFAGYEPKASNPNGKQVWLSWPHVAHDEELIERLRADKQAILYALDNGTLQMADAAENLGHGRA